MKKRWNKLITLLVLSCMVTASFPMCQAHAEEIPAVVTDGNETTESPNQNMQEENADENEENNEENVDQGNGEETETLEENEQSEESSTTDEESESSEEITTSSEETFADSVIEKNKDRINYVFVESPYLESPGTERIAVSYGEGTENIQNLSITVESSDGGLEVWNSAENVSNLYLFEKEYTDDSQAGIYSVIGLNLTDESGTHEVKLSDYDMEALFGVNEKYEGIDELVPLDEESEDTQIEDQEELTYGATVVQINSENPNESVQEIEDALENAEENTDISSTTSSVSVASAISDEVQSIANSSKSGNIVVALDPGHDSKHTGATGIGGLKEEVLTLKIANYCKTELEKYAGVSVYMTRTTSSCPYPSNKSSGGDIGDRVQAAARAGADLFVSFHLNSSSSSGSNGAEVIVPNGNWKPQVASDGRKLAQAILNELKAVGVNMRPTSIYSKDTTVNETYPDGSKSDYFSVQIYAKEAGIPGIIVEHAFLTNSNDVNKFLKTESGLKKLGCADATGIAKYLGLSKKSDNTGWRTINGKTYYYINGKAVTGERQIDGHWYYFDANGIMQTGFVNLGYKIVYYNYNGWMLYGEHQLNGYWYYFDTGTGAMQTGFVNLGHKIVYYNAKGQMQYGEHQLNGYWYYFDTGTGAMQTGFVNLGHKIVYYDTKGQMQYGEHQLNGYWYYFDTGTGAMQTGFVNLGHKIVYYNAKGQMQYGEHQLNGYWYYFDTGTGAMQTGFVNLGHKIVYYNTEGQMQYGEHQINGYWYYFDTGSGAMQTGFVNLGHKIVYYNAEGQMQYGEHQIDGYWYYFDTGSGAMQKNAEINGKYYDADGKYQELHKIMNDPTTSVEKMVRYYRNRNLSYPSEKLAVGGADSIEKLANIFYEEATAEGIDPAIAWCQTMKETNWLRYGGQVKIEQFNFAGIGATDGGAAGADFSSYGKNGVRMGVRAQMQHLKAYAVKGISKNDLKYECVDPRFKYVNKGSAMYVEWLGINENPNGSGWATAPKYGYSIMNDYVKNLWKL
jgi:glucan-binding YG repeat protein/N-acetylmuramoyl-L-alanine amidase